MSDIHVKYPYDPTGRNSSNLISSEPHQLVAIEGCPYKIVTMNDGGFYAKTLKVYDADYEPLAESIDYIVTYNYARVSQETGLKVCQDIVFLNPNREGTVYLTAQIVGSDIAFSLTGIEDYVAWLKTQASDYVPRMFDYTGTEPTWGPGELDQARWKLDTYQPFNNELYQIGRAAQAGRGVGEDDFRNNIRGQYNDFLAKFNDRLAQHIADYNNPHQDDKVQTQIGLGLVQNYALATSDQSIGGVANGVYQTPALSWATLNKAVMEPLNAHINNQNNPHQTTPDKIDSPTKAVVDAAVAAKYGKNDTVVDASYFTDGNNNYGYDAYYTYARSGLNEQNFKGGGGDYGYFPPGVVGRGSTGSDKLLRSGPNPTWVTIDALIQELAPVSKSNLYILAMPLSTNPDTAFALAVSQPYAQAAPLGSIILYRLYYSVWHGTGNGGATETYAVAYGAYKSASGWVKLLR